MEQCQKSAKNLYGPAYQDKIQWYKQVITGHSKKHEKDILESVIEISSMEGVKDNGVAIMLFMAAAVEIIEDGQEIKKPDSTGFKV